MPHAQKGDCGIGGAFLTVPNVALVIRACSLSDGETKIKNQTATRWPVRRPACLCSCLCCSYPHAERGLTGLRCPMPLPRESHGVVGELGRAQALRAGAWAVAQVSVAED